MPSDGFRSLFSAIVGAVQNMDDKSFLATCKGQRWAKKRKDLRGKELCLVFKSIFAVLFASLKRLAKRNHISKRMMPCAPAHSAVECHCYSSSSNSVIRPSVGVKCCN